MRITELKRGKRKDRVEVHLDSGPGITIATEIALAEGLAVGRDLDDHEIAALQANDDACRARDAALNLLSYRQRSERELQRRLRLKGFDETVVDRCIDGLRRAGLIDDPAFARAFAADRLRSRPSGRSRIIAELRQRGIGPDDAAAAADEAGATGGETELDLARRAVVKFARRDREDALRVKRRLHGYLSRRGFTHDTIARILEEELLHDTRQ